MTEEPAPWWFGSPTILRAVAARVLRCTVVTFEDAQGKERIVSPGERVMVEHRKRAGFRQVVGAYKGRYTDAPEPMSSHGYGNVGWWDAWPGEPVPLQGKEYDRFELEPEKNLYTRVRRILIEPTAGIAIGMHTVHEGHTGIGGGPGPDSDGEPNYFSTERRLGIYEVACPAQHGAHIYRAWRDDLSIFDNTEDY